MNLSHFCIVETLVKSKVNTKTTCAHCGVKCESKGEDVPSFCCTGCETVYHFMHSNGLSYFYELNKTPGVSQKDKARDTYDHLDDPIVRAKLLAFESPTICKVQLELPKIHCISCLWLLENIQRIEPGIQNSKVNYLEKKVMIQYDQNSTSLKKIVELLDHLGYPPSITLSHLDEQKPKKNKEIFYKLGLSGFVFGNIMLLSFPEYLGLDESEAYLAQYFRYINLILVIPSLVYCAKDYFRSAWLGLKQKHLNIDVPIALGMLSLYIKSSIDILWGLGPGYMDSLAGLIFFLLIGKWFQTITYDRIRFDLDYKSFMPLGVNLINGKKEKKVAIENINEGDVIRLRHGELIPVDGTLISKSAEIDYSFVTGEQDLNPVFQEDQVYSGGRISGKYADIEVLKKVDASYLTQLWNDDAFKKENEHATGQINRIISKYFTLVILLIAVGSFAYHSQYGIGRAIDVFASVLIIACPCALALTIPFTIGNLVRVFARRNIYFKNTEAFQRAAEINHIVFDKTGTITEANNKSTKYIGRDISPEVISDIVSVANQSTHVKSQMIVNYFDINKIDEPDYIEEIVGQGLVGIINNKTIRIGSKKFMEPNELERFETDFPNAKNSNVYIEVNERIVGAFKKQSVFIKGLSKVLSSLNNDHHISLISGDNTNDRKDLNQTFKNWHRILFKQSPQDKLDFIRQLKTKDQKVAMVGDGLNDAGALKMSDLGIAVTEETANFTPASDVIICRDSVKLLPALFKIAQQSVGLIYFCYSIAFIYNIIGLSFAVRGLLSPVIAAILMPLSSTTVVLLGVLGSHILLRKLHNDARLQEG